jgi:undecaprenyl-diphosphatase
MIEYFEEIDRTIVVAINGLNSPLLDSIMWIISSKSFWYPFYVVLLFLAFKKLNRKAFYFFILFVVLSIISADLISVHLFKNIFQRYRPSHNLLIENKLHYYLQSNGEYYKGGEYGFVSSHAANFAAICMASWLVLKHYFTRLKWVLIATCLIVCFSRIYLGVHYLSDVFVGSLVGISVAFLIHQVISTKHL